MTRHSPELHAREQRVTRIRRRVVVGASGLFLATTGGIVVQLVSGHDPALAKASQASTPATSPDAGYDPGGYAEPSGPGSNGPGPSGGFVPGGSGTGGSAPRPGQAQGSGSPSDRVAPLTTSQS